MQPRIIVIGAANVDITAETLKAFRPNDSNPSRVHISFGGVGRNIAHNLRLMGAKVRFVTVFGEDMMSRALYDDCKKLGMQLEPCIIVTEGRSNYFICINDQHGDMQAGAADTSLLDNLKPEYLSALKLRSNSAAALVADCNLRENTLQDLARSHCGLMYIDATSAAKARMINSVLMLHHTARVVVKANRLEAQSISRMEADAPTMAQRIIDIGAERVYITLGSEGVYCHDGREGMLMPAIDFQDDMKGLLTPAAVLRDGWHGVFTPADISRIVNTTGAGDAFMAGMVMGEISGLPAFEAAQWGLRAANLTLRSWETVNPEMNIEYVRGNANQKETEAK